MEIIIRYPSASEMQIALDKRVAKFNAEYVAEYINKLKCPCWQKLELIDAVAQKYIEQI